MNNNQKIFISGFVGGISLVISLHSVKGLVKTISEYFKSL